MPKARASNTLPPPLYLPPPAWPTNVRFRGVPLSKRFDHRWQRLPLWQRMRLRSATRYNAPYAGHEHWQPDHVLARARRDATDARSALRVAMRLTWPRGAPEASACARARGRLVLADVIADIMCQTPTTAELPLKFVLTSCHLHDAFENHVRYSALQQAGFPSDEEE